MNRLNKAMFSTWLASSVAAVCEGESLKLNNRSGPESQPMFVAHRGALTESAVSGYLDFSTRSVMVYCVPG